jgi:hypothetical protein
VQPAPRELREKAQTWEKKHTEEHCADVQIAYDFELQHPRKEIKIKRKFIAASPIANIITYICGEPQDTQQVGSSVCPRRQGLVGVMSKKIVLSIIVFFTSAAPAVSGDELADFDGVWVTVAPRPGPHFTFTRIVGGREASLPLLGQSRITLSDGRDGSNIKVSGQGFDCYYFYGRITARKMTWDLRSGSSDCPTSLVLEKDPLPQHSLNDR